MKLTKHVVLVLCRVLPMIMIIASCSNEEQSPREPGQLEPLTARSEAVDTSRIIERFRVRGSGPVFIVLTEEPRPSELTALQAVGARGPDGRMQPVHFDSLRIQTIWAHLDADAVQRVAQLPYVVRIESSEDVDSILSHDHAVPFGEFVSRSAASDVGWNITKVRAPDIWAAFGATGWRQTGPTSYQSASIFVLDNGQSTILGPQPLFVASCSSTRQKFQARRYHETIGLAMES